MAAALIVTAVTVMAPGIEPDRKSLEALDGSAA
jgi:hypothetical protein